jgi:hypothetical protein
LNRGKSRRPKSVHDAVAKAEAVLPGQAAADGEVDERWQAIIAVGEFIETEPEQIWAFILRWGSAHDPDLRMAISTCLLEHLLEQHFDNFIGRVEQRVHDDRLFADMVSRCWKFGKSELPERAARFDRLIASVRAQTR